MIHVDASLVAESAGLRMRIDGAGNVLTCRLDGDAVDMLRAVRRSWRLLSTLRFAAPTLDRAGLRIDFIAGKFSVGRIGRGVKQNALARLLRLPNTHVGR